MSIQNGKKPLSSKKVARAPLLTMEDIFGNQLGVSPEIVKAIEAKGLAYRFINAVQLQQFGGHHPRGWRPIKLSEIGCDKLGDTNTFLFGSDPDGYIRRAELILAVRPKEKHNLHKAYLKQEAELRSSKNIAKAQAEELRQSLRGADIDVTEGYGEEDEQD